MSCSGQITIPWVKNHLLTQINPDVGVWLTLKPAIHPSITVHITREDASSNISQFLYFLNRQVFGISLSNSSKTVGVLPLIDLAHTQKIETAFCVFLALELPSRCKSGAYANFRFKTLVYECWQRTEWGKSVVLYESYNRHKWLQRFSNSIHLLDVSNIQSLRD